MSESKKYQCIIEHYESCLEKHGDTHLGVDWPKEGDVELRYKIMLDVIRENTREDLSVLDFGCGASHLYEYILKHNLSGIKYSGLDISDKFIELCRKKFPENKYYCLDILETQNNALPYFDYVVMNGVFTEKRGMTFIEMFEYFKQVISIVFAKTKKGLAFNVMSKAVDWEREDLFHLPLDLLAVFLTKNITRNFVIRNDYGLYEYTAYIYK